MARDEAKVKVRLDTRQAKGDLRGLNRDAERTSKRASASIRSSIGRGLGAVGLGGGIGAGLAAARGATQSGFGDIISETFSGIAQQLNDFVFGDADDKARARRRAREETIASFATVVGATKDTEGAKSFFNSRVTQLRLEEEGKSLLKRELGGPKLGELIDRIMSRIAAELKKAVENLGQLLNPFEGK